MMPIQGAKTHYRFPVFVKVPVPVGDLKKEKREQLTELIERARESSVHLRVSEQDNKARRRWVSLQHLLLQVR